MFTDEYLIIPQDVTIAYLLNHPKDLTVIMQRIDFFLLVIGK